MIFLKYQPLLSQNLCSLHNSTAILGYRCITFTQQYILNVKSIWKSKQKCIDIVVELRQGLKCHSSAELYHKKFLLGIVIPFNKKYNNGLFKQIMTIMIMMYKFAS